MSTYQQLVCRSLEIKFRSSRLIATGGLPFVTIRYQLWASQQRAFTTGYIEIFILITRPQNFLYIIILSV